MPGKLGWPCGRFCWRAHRAARRRRCCDPVRVRHSDLCRRRVLAVCSTRARQMQIERERERWLWVGQRIELEVRYTHRHSHTHIYMEAHLTRRPRPDRSHIKNSGFLFGFGLFFISNFVLFFFHDLLICIFEKKNHRYFIIVLVLFFFFCIF